MAAVYVKVNKIHPDYATGVHYFADERNCAHLINEGVGVAIATAAEAMQLAGQTAIVEHEAAALRAEPTNLTLEERMLALEVRVTAIEDL